MNWWEWVFSGIGVLGIALFIEWMRRRSRSPVQDTAITAQGAPVSDSPVVSGSGSNQNINAPTINVNVNQPPAAPAQTERAQSAQVGLQPRLPNMVLTGVRVAGVQRIGEGVWEDIHPVQDAFIVQFTNEARSAAQNVAGLVKAQLVYRDGVRELRRVTGCWLHQAADMTEFRVDDTHGLMVGLMLGRQFNTVGKRWVRVDINSDEIHTEVVVLEGFEQGIVSVRLSHTTTGDVLYEGQFQLNTRPPEIIRV